MKKKVPLSLGLFAATLLSVTSAAFAQQCKEASWSPEVLTFYGDTAKVAEKLLQVQANLMERRMYLLVSETSGRTEAALFERKENQNVSLSRWETDSNIKLAAMLNDKLLSNSGRSCAGELTKAILRTLGANVDRGDLIPAPKTALAAYGHAWQGAANEYVRVTLFLLC